MSSRKYSKKKLLENNKCIFYYNNNKIYIGEVENGYGKLISKEFNYHGEWYNKKPHGSGFLIDKINNISYQGNFNEGTLNSHGIINYINYKYIGEIVNGLKHGKGKLYFNDNLIYDGFWFEGNVLNDTNLKNVYSNNGKKYLTYNFDFDNSNISITDKNCKEYITYDKKNYILKYEGEVVNNNYEGFGILYKYDEKLNKNFKLYEGIFENNLFNGKGILYNLDESIYFKGNFLNGKISDDSIIINDKINKYEFRGSYNNLEYNENNFYPSKISFHKGELIDFKNSRKLKGYFSYNNLCSFNDSNCIVKNIQDKVIFDGIISTIIKGKYYSDNYFYEGTIVKYYNSTIENLKAPIFKKGKINYYNDKIFEGEFNYQNKLEGNCKIYDKNNVLQKEGWFQNGIMNGRGKIYINNKLNYVGNFYRGYKHGQGTLYDNDNNIIYSGNFYYNEMTN